MNSLYSLFFAAGVAGFAYAKFGRRIGYSDGKSVAMITGVVFVISLVFFYTMMTYVFKTNQ